MGAAVRVKEVAPLLLAISNQESEPESQSALAELCGEARAGSVAVILRDRGLSESRRWQLGRHFGSACERGGQTLVVADRLDLTRLLGARGAHLPSSGFLPSEARVVLGPDAWLSRAGHGLERLSDDELRCLSAVLLSPVCAARKGRAALGFEAFAERTEALRQRAPSLRVYALGGVSAANAGDCLRAGADGVAVMGALAEKSERRRLLRSLEILRS